MKIFDAHIQQYDDWLQYLFMKGFYHSLAKLQPVKLNLPIQYVIAYEHGYAEGLANVKID